MTEHRVGGVILEDLPGTDRCMQAFCRTATGGTGLSVPRRQCRTQRF